MKILIKGNLWFQNLETISIVAHYYTLDQANWILKIKVDY